VSMDDPNAVSGFAFCNIVQSVLRQNFAQVQTFTCGPTSILAAKSHLDPAGMIKSSLQLYWTGTLPELSNEHAPCDYIREEVPGVIPYSLGQPGFSGTSSCIECTPLQNAGLQFMWSQTFNSMVNHLVTKSCDSKVLELRFVGQSEYTSVRAEAYQFSSPWAMLQGCDKVFGSCDYKSVGVDAICAETVDYDNCHKLLQLPDLNGADIKTLEMLFNKGGKSWDDADPSGFYKEQFEEQAGPGGRLAAFMVSLESAQIQLGAAVSAAFWPSMDESAVRAACSASGGALLFLYASALVSPGDENNPFSGNLWAPKMEAEMCNHWTWLEGCDFGWSQDVVSVWSWGQRYYMTRAYFLHAVQLQSGAASSPGCGYIPLEKPQ